MSHEIMKHDNVVLHKTGAWHGLGVVVENAPTPTEALVLANLDWTVDQKPLEVDGTPIDSHVANVRSDTKEVLGVVTPNYTPFQNLEMAQFCESLAEQGDTVTVETAGSIRNGRKVFFLLRGESFSVRGHDDDAISNYLLLSNGFDGATAFRGTPTGIRVVCSNTLHAVIPQYEHETNQMQSLAEASFVFRHTKTLPERVEQAKECLELYGRTVAKQRELIDSLAARDVNRESVKRFFLECYTRDFGDIPDNATKKTEQNRRDRAMDGFRLFEQRFDRERDVAGANAWNMFNAYSGYVQHDRPARIKDAAKASESRIHSNLFGVNAERTIATFHTALSI